MKLYKLEKHNKIHKEGYEAGYAKARKEVVEKVRNVKINVDHMQGMGIVQVVLETHKQIYNSLTKPK